MGSKPLRAAAIGSKLKKQFADPNDADRLKWFEGTVTQYQSRRELYYVVYEDDDAEELTWAELRPLLTGGSTQEATDAAANLASASSNVPLVAQTTGNSKAAKAAATQGSPSPDAVQIPDQERKRSATQQAGVQQQQQHQQPAGHARKRKTAAAGAAESEAAKEPAKRKKYEAAQKPEEQQQQGKPKARPHATKEQADTAAAEAEPAADDRQKPKGQKAYPPSRHWGVSARENASLLVNPEGRALFAAQWQGAQAALADLDAAAAAAEAAAAVVLAPCGKKPLWEVEADELSTVADADVAKHLLESATKYAAGKEPWRRFAVPADLLQQHKEQQKIAARQSSVAGRKGSSSSSEGSSSGQLAAAAAAAPAPREQQNSKKAKRQQDASAAGWQFCEAAVEAQQQGPRIFVAEAPFKDANAELGRALAEADRKFWSLFRLARVTETERVAARKAASEAAAAGGGDTTTASGSSAPAQQQFDAALLSKKPSTRPDRVAENQMNERLWFVNDRTSWGYVPGVWMNNTTQLRSEASALGIHKSPMTGIVYGELPVALVLPCGTYKHVKVATSVCMAGIYEDDKDTAAGEIITYTGEGGNDLLGTKKQREGQQLVRGNRALLANLALGLPVRLLRKNEAKDSASLVTHIFDGLYNVVSFVKTKGVSGHIVFKFGLRRLPGQESGVSKPIPRFKGVSTADTRKKVEVTSRANIVCSDLSKGQEPLPLVVVNEVDRELPPGLTLPEDQQWIIDDKADTDGPLVASQLPFRYITQNEFANGVDPPQPPTVVEVTEAQLAQHWQQQQQQMQLPPADTAPASGGPQLRAAAAGRPGSTGSAVAPKRFVFSSSTAKTVLRLAGESPHDLLLRVNFGRLPYQIQGDLEPEQQVDAEQQAAAAKKKKKPVAVAVEASYVLTECGDWTGCTDTKCMQRQAERGLQHRLEVFKTAKCGWGVRSWDRVFAGQLVAVMWGKVHRVEDIDHLNLQSSYFFDMAPRSDYREDNEHLTLPREHTTKFLVCSKEQGGVARFINHSCEPTLYVQPLCIGHTDTDMVAVGLFAWHDLAPFQELTYDYGDSYIKDNLDCVCYCGTHCCKFKPPVETHV